MRAKVNHKLLDHLLRSRFRSKKELEEVFSKYGAIEKRRTRWNAPTDIKGVYRGQFYRIQRPTGRRKRRLPPLPLLRSPQSAPKGFKPVETPSPVVVPNTPLADAVATAASASSQQTSSRYASFLKFLREWWRQNWSIVVLNFGSICTLTGFTRSDVLELRSFSVTGSLCSVIFQLTLRPFRLVPVLWSATFAAVNAVNIYWILLERKSTVRLTKDQEDIYIEHFMAHGITPKQFETLFSKATILSFRKGSTIIRQGEEQKYVYLVVKGQTLAHVLGRRLSAASVTLKESTEENVELDRPSTGAYIGEMAFLEQYWLKEQAKMLPNKSNNDDDVPEEQSAAPCEDKTDGARRGSKSADKTDRDPKDSKLDPQAIDVNLSSKRTFKVVGQSLPEPKTKNSLYTIMAAEDCTVLRWSHADMEALMARSTDMRAALTRAMTAAIVGKVVHFTVSRGQAKKTWSSWLDDWTNNAGATIQVDEFVEEKGTEQKIRERLPTYPIKRFD